MHIYIILKTCKKALVTGCRRLEDARVDVLQMVEPFNGPTPGPLSAPKPCIVVET